MNTKTRISQNFVKTREILWLEICYCAQQFRAACEFFEVQILQIGFVGGGEFDEREAARQIQFARNVGAVSFDGAVTDE